MNFKRTYSNATTAFPNHCDYACALECGKPHGHGKWSWSIVFVVAVVSFAVLVLSGCGKVVPGVANGAPPAEPDVHGVVCYTFFQNAISCVKVK